MASEQGQNLCPHCSAPVMSGELPAGPTWVCPRCGTSFSGASTSLEPEPRGPGLVPPRGIDLPEEFGRYVIIRKLGQGGMGTVYLAHDRQLNRQVALKVPFLGGNCDPAMIKRFYREARAAARLEHPNLCHVFDVGQIDGIHYLTMPYIDGLPLSHVIGRGKPIPLPQVALIARKVALALAEAHARGVIHRDLKPSNILLSKRRDLVITDFGLARLADADDGSVTTLGEIAGTPHYIAPERLEGTTGATGPVCDIYSLGVILYELITGQTPFAGKPLQVLAKMIATEPPPPSRLRPDLDRVLEGICLKAMARKPSQRYATMGDMASALSAYLKAPLSHDEPERADPPEPIIEVSPSQAPPPTTDTQVGGFFAGLNLEPAPTALATPRPSASRAHSPPPYSLLVVAAATMLLVVIAMIGYIITDRGSVPIELNAFGAELRIDGRSVALKGRGAPITLRTGRHRLSVHRGDREIHAQEIDVFRGENPLVQITPGPQAPSPAPADRPAPAATGPAGGSTNASTITNAIGMTLVRIEAGTAVLGTSGEQMKLLHEHYSGAEIGPTDLVDESPHPVQILSAFYLGKHEVTVGQFRQFVQETGYLTDAEREHRGAYGWNQEHHAFEKVWPFHWRTPGFPQSDAHPVVAVSWGDAQAFCTWLTRKDGHQLVYRLPTDSEWEYACRAGTSTLYTPGDNPESTSNAANVADASFKAENPDWAARMLEGNDGHVFTAPVGSFAANAWGLHDMIGNVCEWCQVGYAPDPDANDETAAKPRPAPPLRIERGGGWCHDPARARPARRVFRGGPDYGTADIGFRVAAFPRSPDGTGTVKVELRLPSDGIELRIDGSTYSPSQLERPLTLKAGIHLVVARQGSQEFQRESLTLGQGQHTVLVVAPLDRRVAEWALRIGARPVVIKYGDQTPSVESIEQLPAGSFEVTSLGLQYNYEIPEDGLRLVRGLKGLQNLNVRNCILTDTGLTSSAGLDALTSFNAYSTPIGDDTIFAISRSPLVELNLTSTPALTDRSLGYLRDCKTLKDLWLNGHNSFTDAGVAQLLGGEFHPTNLRLDFCPGLSEGTAVALGKTTSLEALALAGVPVTDAWLRQWKGLVNLKSLDLQGTQVSGPGFQHLAGLPSLERVVITPEMVTELLIENLKPLKSLRYLQVNGSGLDGDLRDKLRTALPGCTIEG